MLQNHYGDHEHPVRPRWRHARAASVARTAQLRGPSAAWHGISRIAPALAVTVVGIALTRPLAPVLPPWLSSDEYIGLVTVTALVTAFAGLVGGGLRDRGLPVREQRRYHRLAGTRPLTAEQRVLLALDAQSDHAIGAWNDSLEHAPSWRCLPPQVRSTWEHRLGGPLFLTLPLQPVARLRAEVDDRYHIAGRQDLELFVADALAGAGLSGRFHEVLAGPDGERMLTRVASLTGRDVWDLRDLDRARDGRPPQLLWGGDVQRVISVVRVCYVAEHVDAEEAWALVRRAGSVAAAVHAGWDEYWTSVRTAVAFGTDRLDAVQGFDAALAGLRTDGWPAARAAFPGADPTALAGLGPLGPQPRTSA